MIVADAGPLIALARVRQLDLLRRLYRQVLIPPAVLHELAPGSGRPGAAVLEDALGSGWLAEQSATHTNAVSELGPLLDRGEADAIALAMQADAQFLLIDDAKGRRAARQRGIPVVGVAGMLIVAKTQGEIHMVKPILNNLTNIGYRLSAQLVTQVLAKANE